MGQTFERLSVPPEYAEQVTEYRERLVESLAEALIGALVNERVIDPPAGPSFLRLLDRLKP